MAKSRTRKKAATAETQTAEAPAIESAAAREPDVFDAAIAARQQQAAAVASDLPEQPRHSVDAERQAAREHGHATHHERHGHAARHHQPREHDQSHADAVGRKEYKPLPNPFGVESHTAGKNRVQLLKSETDEQRREGRGAWVIRFAHNPNLDPGPNSETYSKENPHPVLKMLKGEGYRWDFDSADGKGGWGKPFTGDRYGQEHLEARRVLQKAADMIGHRVEQGRIPD